MVPESERMVPASEEENTALVFTQMLVNSYPAIFPSTTIQYALGVHINTYLLKEMTHDEIKNYLLRQPYYLQMVK